MLDKLQSIYERYNEINEQLSDMAVISDQEKYKKLMKENKQLTPIVEKYLEYKKVVDSNAEAKELLDSQLDPDFKEIVEAEYLETKELIAKYEEEIKILLLPKDPNDDKNVIVEIRGGAGGEEAALFAHSLYRMYSMYAEAKGYKCEILSLNETELGGIKEISFSIENDRKEPLLCFTICAESSHCSKMTLP